MQSNKRPEKPAGQSHSRRAFTIPKGIAANFKIVGNLSRAEEWRAKVLKGNSGDKYIISKLETIAKGVVGRRRDVFPIAHDLIQWVALNRFAIMRVMDFGTDGTDQTDQLPRWERAILQAEAEGDFDLLARPFFTMDGIKNRLHNRIRKVVQGSKDDYAKEVAGEFWGNLDVALSEFSRLSQI